MVLSVPRGMPKGSHSAECSSGGRQRSTFEPLMANTTTLRRRFEPSVYDCVRIVAVREGTAILFSEFGLRPVRQGDVILLAANTFSGGEPDGNLTITTIYADTDYVLDQVYWQHAGLLRDRLATRDFAATIYTEPAQILHPSESQFDVLTPWLDELRP